MRPLLAAVVVVGLSVRIAKADDKPTPPPSEPSTVAPEKDVRLACLANATPQKIGVLTYYPNKGGGYTFMAGERIEFYSLPYMPTAYQAERTVHVIENRNGNLVARPIVQRINLATIGTAKRPFGGQTIYRSLMTGPGFGTLHRTDIPIAKWTRDTPDGQFRLSIKEEDHETRLKLKSIVPVLEHASK
jgi:hypothetical protein